MDVGCMGCKGCEEATHQTPTHACIADTAVPQGVHVSVLIHCYNKTFYDISKLSDIDIPRLAVHVPANPSAFNHCDSKLLNKN